jgi:hypothetical protein
LHVAGRAHAGDRRVAKSRDEVEIDQHVQHLEQHADRDRRGHAQQMAWNRALRQVLHRAFRRH